MNHLFQKLLYIILAIASLLSPAKLFSQEIKLTLEDVILLAKKNSFDAFKAENLYQVKELDYKTFKRSLFPKAELSVNPANYNRSIDEQWDSETEQYKPFEVQRLTSTGSFYLKQNVGVTGGVLRLSSNLRRSMTFNENKDDVINYISTPMSLSYQQNFSKINSFRWRSKIDPLKFEEAKNQYLEDSESVTIKTVSLFFELLNAGMNYNIALLNKRNADTLFVFGRKKLEIGSISRDEYLNLQLRKVNAGISLDKALLAKDEAQLELSNFLELPRETIIKCEEPQKVPEMIISLYVAMDKAFKNNPDIIALQRKLLEAQRQLKQAKSNRFDANFNASVGLNQNQDNLGDAYHDLRDKQTVSFALTIPLLNWGDNAREITQARINEEIVVENSRKQKDRIELDVIKKVKEFNIKRKQVMAASQADTISRFAYDAVQQRFMLGKASVLNINDSYKALQGARNNYLSSLKNYWLQYYTMRKLCLYDFERKKDLRVELEEIVGE